MMEEHKETCCWITLARRTRNRMKRECRAIEKCLSQYNQTKKKQITMDDLALYRSLIEDAYKLFLRTWMLDKDCAAFTERVHSTPVFLIKENKPIYRDGSFYCAVCDKQCKSACEGWEDPHMQLEFARRFSKMIEKRLSGTSTERFSARTVGLIMDLCISLRVFAYSIQKGAVA